MEKSCFRGKINYFGGENVKDGLCKRQVLSTGDFLTRAPLDNQELNKYQDCIKRKSQMFFELIVDKQPFACRTKNGKEEYSEEIFNKGLSQNLRTLRDNLVKAYE